MTFITRTIWPTTLKFSIAGCNQEDLKQNKIVAVIYLIGGLETKLFDHFLGISQNIALITLLLFSSIFAHDD